MELIDQHTKKIMEGCKKRARDAGLSFQDESLEYIVTNRDLLELSPKNMIPTLYDYWVHDVEVMREKGKYELYPHNPYETVINTRPAISFYNDNNPDWLNVMIFYHVLGHIDFFQNNLYFRHTWDYDFTGEALSDKRMFTRLRAEKGRWVEYIIEFARGIDNLVGYHKELSAKHERPAPDHSKKVDFYFDIFLQKVKKIRVSEYIKEIERFNSCRREMGGMCEDSFFSDVEQNHPEFNTMFNKSLDKKPKETKDLLQFLMMNSKMLNNEKNNWMKTILQIVRKTSLFFQPQIRTKIMNEGWASYWHDTLFMKDDRIAGHEVDYARVNAGVTSMPRVGLNPYALGMRMFSYIEELAEKGKMTWDFQKIKDADERRDYDKKNGNGQDQIFKIRENLCDFTFLNTFVDQDFVTKNKLFVSGKRLNESKMVWEYYVKSRNAADYRDMLLTQLYHPPHIVIDLEKSDNGQLYLVHKFEEKPLIKDFLDNTMLGIEYLWGGPVHLETHEVVAQPTKSMPPTIPIPGVPPQRDETERKQEIQWQRVQYSMEDRKLSKKKL
ncbi:MAG: SpoVR family protein [Desulfobacteraceae bacterium]|nr:SpoVR family protein [Desulfobacteraceae bacterium]